MEDHNLSARAIVHHLNPDIQVQQPEYSNATGRNKNDLKVNFINMTEVVKVEMNKSLKEIQESTHT